MIIVAGEKTCNNNHYKREFIHSDSGLLDFDSNSFSSSDNNQARANMTCPLLPSLSVLEFEAFDDIAFGVVDIAVGSGYFLHAVQCHFGILVAMELEVVVGKEAAVVHGEEFQQLVAVGVGQLVDIAYAEGERLLLVVAHVAVGNCNCYEESYCATQVFVVFEVVRFPDVAEEVVDFLDTVLHATDDAARFAHGDDEFGVGGWFDDDAGVEFACKHVAEGE